MVDLLHRANPCKLSIVLKLIEKITWLIKLDIIKVKGGGGVGLNILISIFLLAEVENLCLLEMVASNSRE